MAVTLVTASLTGMSSSTPDSRRSGLVSELWTVTGTSSVANDTGTITPQFGATPVAVIGGVFGATISGAVITLTDTVGIGNKVFTVEVLSRT